MRILWEVRYLSDNAFYIGEEIFYNLVQNNFISVKLLFVSMQLLYPLKQSYGRKIIVQVPILHTVLAFHLFWVSNTHLALLLSYEARICFPFPAIVYFTLTSALPHVSLSVAQTVKNLPSNQGTQVQSLSEEDPLKKGMATPSSILDWRIPWTEDPGSPQSKRFQIVGHD